MREDRSLRVDRSVPVLLVGKVEREVHEDGEEGQQQQTRTESIKRKEQKSPE